MPKLLKVKRFVVFWQTSSSLTEVSVKLHRTGHDYEPEQVAMLAWGLSEFGVNLKQMPKSDLPALVEAELDMAST